MSLCNIGMSGIQLHALSNFMFEVHTGVHIHITYTRATISRILSQNCLCFVMYFAFGFDYSAVVLIGPD